MNNRNPNAKKASVQKTPIKTNIEGKLQQNKGEKKDSLAARHPIITPIIIALLITIFNKPIESLRDKLVDNLFVFTDGRLTSYGYERLADDPESDENLRVYSLVRNTGNSPFVITNIQPFLAKDGKPDMSLLKNKEPAEIPRVDVMPGTSISIKTKAYIPEDVFKDGRNMDAQYNKQFETYLKNNPNKIVFPYIALSTKFEILGWNDEVKTATVESFKINSQGMKFNLPNKSDKNVVTT